jgi:7-keto-8-aminopelargonate synthetase-like enzyme
LAGRLVEGPISARIRIDGRPYINFFGAGYLALSGIAEIRAAVFHELSRGVGFSRSMPASHQAMDPIFDAVERAGAAALETEASVFFSSGYLIGRVALASLHNTFDFLLIDEQAHYSLRDGATLSGAPVYTFRHCDAESLEAVLAQRVRPGERPLLLTDGAFATTGRIAPLADYASLLERYDGRLCVDESHAFGVVGENGRGAAEHCGVADIATTGTTLSKALCANGALVGCSVLAAEHLRGVPPVGTANAGSPLSAVAATASLGYVARHPELRKNLRSMAEQLRNRLRRAGLETVDSPAPIVAFRYGARSDMLALQRRALEKGVYLHYSTYIGAGAEGLIRCAVFRDHSDEDLDALMEVLG